MRCRTRMHENSIFFIYNGLSIELECQHSGRLRSNRSITYSCFTAKSAVSESYGGDDAGLRFFTRSFLRKMVLHTTPPGESAEMYSILHGTTHQHRALKPSYHPTPSSPTIANTHAHHPSSSSEIYELGERIQRNAVQGVGSSWLD
jgi:hypothetical protein